MEQVLKEVQNTDRFIIFYIKYLNYFTLVVNKLSKFIHIFIILEILVVNFFGSDNY